MFFWQEEFEFPEALSQSLVQALWECEHADKIDARKISATAATLQNLWTKLALKRGQERGQGRDAHYSFDSKMTHAYAAYYLPANLLKVYAVLEEMRLLGIDLSQNSLSWLDVGCGPGTALWGASWWMNSQNSGAGKLEYVGVDQSLNFTGLGSRLARTARFSAEWKTPKKMSAKVLAEIFQDKKSDVVSFVNSIAEIEADVPARTAFTKALVDEMNSEAVRLGKTKWLIFIEPGSKNSSRELHQLREMLRTDPRVKIWLPCLSGRACGAYEKPEDWCHEDISCKFPEWMNELGAAASLKKESMLFSYLVCSVGVHPEVLGWPDEGQRVVSQRIQEKGLTRCFVCTKNGRKGARLIHSRANENNEKFLQLVRGGIFTKLELDEKSSVLDLIVHSHKDNSTI